MPLLIVGVVVGILFIFSVGLKLYALLLNLAVFFANKMGNENDWLDFSFILFIVALLITSLNNYGIYLVYYMSFVVILEAVILAWIGGGTIFYCYVAYKNSDWYQAKKLKKEEEKFNKKYAKTELLLESLKNKELAKTHDENKKTTIENKSQNLKNAFMFLADEHKIIINRGDIKIINKTIEEICNENKLVRFKNPASSASFDNVLNGGMQALAAITHSCPVFVNNWLIYHERVYKKILARHQAY